MTEEALTITRSLIFPISGPGAPARWADLRAALRASWGDSTSCANWMFTQLYAADVRRGPTDKKLPKMPRTYLYPEARKLFPSLASQTVASLEREVTRKYRARRYDLIWTQSISLPIMRYPVGLPIPSQMWRLELIDERWHFSCRLGNTRFNLRLRGGPAFARYSALLPDIASGTIPAGAGTLYRVAAHDADHRTGFTSQWRLMLRLPIELPPRKAQDAKGTLNVRTSTDALIIAADTDRVWTEHCDHIRRAIIAHQRQLQHLSDDLKAERRRPTREREGIVARMGRLATNHSHRMRSWLHEVAAHLTGYAKRRNFAAIFYDDSDRSFISQFPWHELKARIAEKCELAGIEFKPVANEPAAKEDAA